MAARTVPFFTESFEGQIDDLLRRICLDLQLDDSRYKLADTSYRAVAKYLDSHSFVTSLRPSMYPQGSMQLNTTTKPLVGDEYDLDFVCEFGCSIWYFGRPVEALDLVERTLRANAIYDPMVERLNRCIRLNYQHQFHMDILPACHDPENGGTCILVPDRKLGDWTPSNPKGFASWFEQRGRQLALDSLMEKAEPIPTQEVVEAKATLKLCVQLLKRRRDVRYKNLPELAPISIILTTLAGEIYRGEQSISRAVGNALTGICAKIQSSYPRRLVVRNPKNSDEDLSERWETKPGMYREFVDYTKEFEAQWKSMLQTRGIDKIAKILENLFGEQLAKKVVESQTRDIESLRSKNALGIRKESGIITAVLGGSVVPIRPNTFFGDAE